MNPIRILFLIATALVIQCGSSWSDEDKGDWKRALPGYKFEFPRDHHAHPDFKTEWWYATGNLKSESGDKLGFQFTIFRQGIRKPGNRPEVKSRFVQDHFYFAHVAISDISRGKFYYGQISSRGVFGEAGYSKIGDTTKPLAWLPDCDIKLLEDGAFQIRGKLEDAKERSFALDLKLKPAGPPVIQGENSVSQKSAAEGQASHYYSFPNLTAEGTMSLGELDIDVKGSAWLDREWSTSMLANDQVGWDWFALHLDDGRQLMLYQLRLKDGSPDPASSGTLVAEDRSTRKLKRKDFSLEPLELWESPHSGGRYPRKWRIQIPSEKIDLTVETEMDDQELALTAVRYYEGAVRVTGSQNGEGYMELTGYAGALDALTPGVSGENPE